MKTTRRDTHPQFHRTSIGNLLNRAFPSAKLFVSFSHPFTFEIGFSIVYSRQLEHKGKIRGSEQVVDAKCILFATPRSFHIPSHAPLRYIWTLNARFPWPDASFHSSYFLDTVNEYGCHGSFLTRWSSSVIRLSLLRGPTRSPVRRT